MATLTYTYSAFMALPDNAASGFGLNVIGLAGQAITDVSVTLTGLNHTFAGDLDILLLGPNGINNLLFMSDVRNFDDFVDTTLTFSDSGTGILGDAALSAPIDSGDFLPATFSDTETDANFGTFTGGINHAGAGATFAGAFAGLNPEGVWGLYVRDDAALDTGSIASWSLTISILGDIVTLNGAGGNDFYSVAPSGATGGEFSVNGDTPVLYSGVDHFVINAGGGNDVAFGSAGGDFLTGGDGRDQLYGVGGDDKFFLNLLNAVAGEIYDGGSGLDSITFSGTGSGYTYDLRTLTLRSIERLNFDDPGIIQTGEVRLNAAQFGTGFSLTGTVDGFSFGDVSDVLAVTMGTVSTLDLSGLTMVDFAAPGDRVVITGDGSAETITGTTAHDEIFGNGGADILNGFSGADLMRGGLGDDRYYVDNAGDVTDETTGGGGTFDLVLSWVTFTAALGIERLQLSGSANINAIGANAQNDSLYGNTGNNILNGLTGADTMRGGLGNDTYYVDDAGDWTDEVTGGGGGFDTVNSYVNYTVLAGIEVTNLLGSNAINGVGRNLQNDVINGNSAVNVINGLSGDDTLDGGLASDSLVGGLGLDIFKFTSSLAAPNMDTITDYSIADDSIQLDNAIFTLLGGVGALAANLFKNLALGAQDADDVIIYNQATGALFYDSNGLTAGGQTQFADLTNGLVMTASEFTVI